MTIQDLSGNPIPGGGTTGTMLGFVESEASALSLDMYSFLIEEMRHADEHGGALFLKRFLDGPQQEWRDVTARILSIKRLWSLDECPDEFLPYLKNILGWTAPLNTVTDRLDADGLRRLIGSSAALWKGRGTEDAVVNVLRLMTGARCRLVNWFQKRWLIGQNALAEQHQIEVRDVWLIERPDIDGATDHNTMNVRIVDNGSLDRVLVVELARIMRPVNERFRITYVGFMELFDVAGDNTQWGGVPMVVADGVASLLDDSDFEHSYVIVEGAKDWTSYSAYWRVRGSGEFGASFYATNDGDDRYDVVINVSANLFALYRVSSGIRSGIQAVLMRDHYMELKDNRWYGIRVHVTPEGVFNRVIVRLDNLVLIDVLDGVHDSGAVGVFHDGGGTVEVDEVEMFRLPLASDYVDINS